MQMKIATILALGLASTTFALPSPNAEPEAFSIAKRCNVCKPKGSVCQSGCHTVSPTDIVKACGALKINIGACPGLEGIISGALSGGAHAGVDVDVNAGIDADTSAKWNSICGHLGVPAGAVTIQGGLDVSATASVGASVGGWLGGFIGGGHCGVCGW